MFSIKKGTNTISKEIRLDLTLSWNSSYEIFNHKNSSKVAPHAFHVYWFYLPLVYRFSYFFEETEKDGFDSILKLHFVWCMPLLR